MGTMGGLALGSQGPPQDCPPVCICAVIFYGGEAPGFRQMLERVVTLMELGTGVRKGPFMRKGTEGAPGAWLLAG